MIRTILATLLALCTFSGQAIAETCNTYPTTLTNGTTADATQVMADFNYVLNCATAALRGSLGGLTMSNDVTTPNTVIDTAAGVVNADDATTIMKLSAFTKNTNAAWVVGSANGCLDSGSSLAASTWYHLFVIARTDTGVVDELCSTSATAPTLPTNYTKKRRIGSFKTDGSSHILGFVQTGDEFLWKTSVADVNNVSIGTTALTPTLTVPTGVKVNSVFRAIIFNSNIGALIFTSPDQDDQSAGAPHNDLENPAGEFAAARFNITTNTSAQIRVKAASTSSYWISTVGWIDSRGRFQ